MSNGEKVTLSESGEKSLLIRCIAPGAQSVFLSGTFNNWALGATPMRRDEGDDEWRVAISLLPGRYEYKFIVDGEWCCDPPSVMSITPAKTRFQIHSVQRTG